MPLIQVKVKHGKTLGEARDRLAGAVSQVRSQFGALIKSTDWSEARDAVTLTGPGVRLELRVDASDVHVSGDIPLLASLVGSSRLKQIVESTFH